MEVEKIVKIIFLISAILGASYGVLLLGKISGVVILESIGDALLKALLIFIFVLVAGIILYLAYNYHQEHSGR